MRYQLADPVRILSGVGLKMAQGLENMGIVTMADLLSWYPRRYIDGSKPVPVASAQSGLEQAFHLTIESLHEGYTKKRGIKSLSAYCTDESGGITVQWFNQPYLKNKLKPGSTWIMIGKFTAFRGERILRAPRLEQRPVIIPIYPQTATITSRLVHSLVLQVLDEIEILGSIPGEVIQEEGLLEPAQAMSFLHRPTGTDEIALAQKTLAFQEAWDFFVRMEAGKELQAKEKGIPIPADADFLHKITETLPFTLTVGQKRAIWEAAQDMAGESVMTRLLNGDVGSGKTVVAGILATLVAKAGYKSIFLAPTEILAEQHYATLQRLFAQAGIKVGLWTAHHQDTAAPTADVVVGTHALLYDTVTVQPLGLLIVDEQHRFGVQQRAKLREQQAELPHVLSMTATPIPRTLALTIFADLAVSQLTEKPAGRMPIKTFLIGNEAYRARMHERIKEEVAAGRQVFVVCPAIQQRSEEENAEPELTLFSEASVPLQGKRAVEEEVKRLRTIFPDVRIGMVHGKLKAAEKSKVMEGMEQGAIDILVATSVVEVGVDIPNASLMVIEGAESFGLAQLHQLRGRVGRGSAESFCFLCPHKMSQKVRERLQVLVDSDDGFVIAEADLANRGPGDVQGLSQSGLPDFRMASLTDLDFLHHVRECVQAYVPDHPQVLDRISKHITSTHTQRLE
jgi:ATP-dependent DNA helicase RecG